MTGSQVRHDVVGGATATAFAEPSETDLASLAPAVDGGSALDGASPVAHLPLEAMSMFSAIAMASANENVGQLLTLVARGAAALLSVSRCAVYLRDQETGLFAGRCSYGAPRFDRDIRSSACGHDSDGLTREIVATRGAVAVTNARQDPRPMHNAVLQWGVHSLIGAPIVHGDEVIGLIFLDDSRPHVYDRRDLKLLETFGTLIGGVIARSCESDLLRDQSKALAEHNKGLRLMLTFGDRLAQAVAAGAGLGEVATTVADFTRKTCAIYDRRGRRRAVAAPSKRPDEHCPDFPSSLSAMPELAKAVAAAEPGEATVFTPSDPGGRPRRLLLLPAPEGSPEGGTILLQEGAAQRLHVVDAKAIRHAAAMVDLIVRAELDRTECLRALTSALLLGQDAAGICARAERHAVDLTAPRVVCLFAGRGNDGALSEDAVADRFLQATGEPAALMAPVGSRVAVLLDLDADAPVPERIEHVKRTLSSLAGGSWSVGMSSPCYQTDDYAHALAEAEQALAACTRANVPVATVDDLGASYLLTFGIDSAQAARFARTVMAPLLDDPSTAGAVLVETLSTFFASGRNIRLTAQHLDVHENTIRYRLGSVKRRTGLDVAGDPRDELAVQLALELMHTDVPPSARPSLPLAG